MTEMRKLREHSCSTEAGYKRLELELDDKAKELVKSRDFGSFIRNSRFVKVAVDYIKTNRIYTPNEYHEVSIQTHAIWLAGPDTRTLRRDHSTR
ncbi:hypothetical protein E4U54_005590 [Claviceps lovelessii]|nr:hypothetical protein E4U54_005590 [Claviceps lovelessii]